MKKLKFNRELVKKRYLERYEELKFNPKKLELLLLRSEILCRNPLFINDYIELTEQKDNENFREKTIEFRNKWNFDFETSMYQLLIEKEPPVRFTGGDPEKQYIINCDIDLRYPKRKILEELNSILNKWQNHYDENHKQPHYAEYYDPRPGDPKHKSKEMFIDHVDPTRVRGNILADTEDYEKYLKVWDMKQNMSWRQIAKELKMDFQVARNYYNAAKRLITKGLPGFPPFPQE